MNNTTNTAGIDLDLDKLEALARAATPQNIDSAEDASRPTGYIECPECGGEGTVELTADYCNYDGKAMGVQFYGVGPEHLAAEAFFRAANPATVLQLIQLVRRSTSERGDWIGDVIRDVAELPDRDSPNDQPEILLVAADELRDIIAARAPKASGSDGTADAGAGGLPFPERDPTKPASQQGLYNKFYISRVDGSDTYGGKHFGCRYFVLDLTHDQNAPAAMRAYADSCAKTHPALAADLRAEFGRSGDGLTQQTGTPAIGYAVYGINASGKHYVRAVKQIDTASDWKIDDDNLGDRWAGNEALGVIVAQQTGASTVSPSIDQQAGAPAEPIDAYTAPHDHPPLVEIAVRLAKQNREWSGKQIEEAARAEYATVLAAPAPAAQDERDAKDAARYRWLRNEAIRDYVEFNDTLYECGEALDEAVDTHIVMTAAAMSQAKGAGQEGAA